MKLERLHGRKISDYLLRKGNIWKGKTMIVRWLSGAPRHPNIDPSARAIYLGTFASVKLDKSAVKRNRMRRRIREAFRVIVTSRDDLPTFQLLMTPKIASLRSPFSDIEDDVRAFLSIPSSWHNRAANPASSTSQSSSR